MSYGHPVLGSDIPEITEITENYGFIHKNKDIDDLTSKLEDLIKASPETIRQAGLKAKKYVEAEYTWDTAINSTIKVYNNLVGSKIVARKPIRVPNS